MKKIIIAFCMMVSACAVHADYLYWMVSDDKAASASGDEVYAYLRASSSSDYANTISSPNPLQSATGAQVAAALEDGIGFAYDLSQLSGASSYYFYVELVNGEKTTPTSLANLNDYIVHSGSGMNSSNLNVAGFGSGTTTYNVPEPTSGLLFVIGGMLLGLKRKRQV